MGNKGELRPGDLQWMTPGRGIMHAEMPATTDKCHGLQLWVNLPKEKKLMAPRYQEIQREQVPHAFNDDKSVEAIVFAGEAFGKSGPIQTEAPVTYVHFILQPGAKLEYALPASHNVFVYGISGSGLFGDKSIEPHEAFIMSRDGDGVALSAAPCRQPLELIVISGQPLEEPVFQYGPFVMSSQEEIQSTLRDFELCTNGFEAAEGWRSEIGRRW